MIPMRHFLLSLITFSFVCGFELTVLHVNDIHSRFEETNSWSGSCKEDSSNCFGGLARLSQAVQDIQANEANNIFLFSGDFYQGNAWYTLFKWEVVVPFANLMNFTALAPGNHEFDDKVDGFVPFLKNSVSPIVCANINASNEPDMAGLIHPSVVVEREGVKIGLIGYLTPETSELSDTGKIVLLDEVDSISAEIDRLKEIGCKIFIAFGHSGYERELELAKNIPDIDLIVGGHSHSFLFSGDPPPSTESPVGEYPTVVTQPNGRRVPVVQAYAYTKYLGYLKVNFDDEGEVISWSGNPILLDGSFPQEEEILEELKPWREEIEEKTKEVIGQTLVRLDISREEEALQGNFICDSMVDWFLDNPEFDANGNELKTSTCVLNVGVIRAAFEIGNVTMGDALATSPYANSIDIVSLDGSTIRKIFEFSASTLDENGQGKSGSFLQVSGFQVVYNVSLPINERVTLLLVKCADCEEETWEEIDDGKIYHVTMVSFMAAGQDGFDMIPPNKLGHVAGAEDIPVLVAYFKKASPVDIYLEGRITVVTPEVPQRGSKIRPHSQHKH